MKSFHREVRSQPAILVVCGPPCSGKSTISKMLHEQLGFPRFAMDELRLATWPNSHTAEDRANAYARMHELAVDAIESGARGAILDATYQPAQQRRSIKLLVDRTGASVLIVECRVSPDEAVVRFENRTGAHAAIDLSAERVWDLAFDFPFSDMEWTESTDEMLVPGEVVVVPSINVKNQIVTEAIVSSLVRKVRSLHTMFDISKWIARVGAAPPNPQERPKEGGEKLNARSRSRAWWGRLWAIAVVAFCCATAATAFLIFLKSALDLKYPTVLRVGIEGKPQEWIIVWAALAGLAAGILAAWGYFLDGHKSKANKMVTEAGRVPRLSLREVPPSNPDLYRRYQRRLPISEPARMPVIGVPLWFLVLPRPQGFDVMVEKVRTESVGVALMQALRMENPIHPRIPLDEDELVRRAAQVGLDWKGFERWVEKQCEDQYFNSYREKEVRILGVKEDESDETMVRLTACPGDFKCYVSTELAANYSLEGRYGFSIREILEGRGWRQWQLEDRCGRADGTASCRACLPNVCHGLDLGDLRHAAKTHEMLVGVQVGLTTSDGFLILQRRSRMVQTATGGVTSSAAGAAMWNDFGSWRKPRTWFKNSLALSALRETAEEIGWHPTEADDIEAPFLGAAFNLLRGRDLNFYCHFHTASTLEQITERAGKARDSWEVAHLIAIPVKAVSEKGRLEPRFDTLVGDGRHVRGLLYCLAQSEKFRSIQNGF